MSSGYVGDMSEVGDSVLSSFVWNLDLVFAQAVADVAAIGPPLIHGGRGPCAGPFEGRAVGFFPYVAGRLL